MIKTLSRPLRAARLLTLLREVDLGAIRREAEARFSVYITGDPEGSAGLAAALSETPGRSGVHPYLNVQGDAVPADLRVVVQRGFGALANEGLPSAVPTLVVCVTAEGPAEVGAELPRPGEAGRVAITELNAEGVRETIPALLRALPPMLHLSAARHLPVFRPVVIRGLIEEASRTNALYAAGTGVAEVVPVLNVPLNVADTVVLTKNQLVMAYKIALAAGKDGTPKELMTEIIGVLGGGLLFRQTARGLVGLIPVWGLVPKVAVAYAGTQVIGTATALWAAEGRTVSADDLRGLYRGALGRGRSLAQRLLPGRGSAAEAPPGGSELPRLEPPHE